MAAVGRLVCSPNSTLAGSSPVTRADAFCLVAITSSTCTVMVAVETILRPVSAGGLSSESTLSPGAAVAPFWLVPAGDVDGLAAAVSSRAAVALGAGEVEHPATEARNSPAPVSPSAQRRTALMSSPPLFGRPLAGELHYDDGGGRWVPCSSS